MSAKADHALDQLLILGALFSLSGYWLLVRAMWSGLARNRLMLTQSTSNYRLRRPAIAEAWARCSPPPRIVITVAAAEVGNRLLMSF